MKYMCQNCYSIYNTGGVCSKCNGDLVEIDDLLCPIISQLNKKGYKTISCCSGHNDNYRTNKTYISFKNNYVPDELPKGFVINNNGEKTIIYKPYNKKVDIRDLENLIIKTVLQLLDWVVKLDDYTIKA